MSDNEKKPLIFCAVLLIGIIGAIFVNRQADELLHSFPDVPFFLEITVADNVEFDIENRFEISSFFTTNQEPNFERTGGRSLGENLEIGETAFTLPVRPAHIRAGEIVEFQIYQLTQAGITADNTNRFQDNEWVSDDGWLIDETIFYLTFEVVAEGEALMLEITKSRYENGNYIHIQVDEIRFVNHYFGRNS